MMDKQCLLHTRFKGALPQFYTWSWACSLDDVIRVIKAWAWYKLLTGTHYKLEVWGFKEGSSVFDPSPDIPTSDASILNSLFVICLLWLPQLYRSVMLNCSSTLLSQFEKKKHRLDFQDYSQISDNAILNWEYSWHKHLPHLEMVADNICRL